MVPAVPVPVPDGETLATEQPGAEDVHGEISRARLQRQEEQSEDERNRRRRKTPGRARRARPNGKDRSPHVAAG